MPEHAYNFNGYQFWFINVENRQLFIADPWKYAPAWGGFCSWGIALETKATGWPWQVDFLGPPASPWEGWIIIDGVLTFNIWSSYTDKFMQNVDENVQLAIANWKAMFDGELQSGPFNTHCIGHGSMKNWCLKQQPSPWLEPLPECIETKQSNGTVVVEGGGIVSNIQTFDEFSNSSKSPKQRRWIISGAIILPIIACLLMYCLCCKKPRRRADSHDLEGVMETASRHDDNSDEEEGGSNLPHKENDKTQEDDHSADDTDDSPTEEYTEEADGDVSKPQQPEE